MDEELTFRLLLGTGFAIVLPILIWHRLKARTGEKLDRLQEGLFILVAVRLVGLVGMIGFITYFFHPAAMQWAAIPLPAWLRWTGVGVGLFAAVMLFWTLRNLGRNLTDTVVTRKQHTLVTTGPYRWVRHPFYVTGVLAVLGNSLVAANAFFLGAGLLMFLLWAIRSRKEEENLIARFGDDYRNYARRTGRFLPRLY
jgi:protein-S-isoprenylcysteine O-methyltransferase Ste14